MRGWPGPAPGRIWLVSTARGRTGPGGAGRRRPAPGPCPRPPGGCRDRAHPPRGPGDAGPPHDLVPPVPRARDRRASASAGSPWTAGRSGRTPPASSRTSAAARPVEDVDLPPWPDDAALGCGGVAGDMGTNRPHAGGRESILEAGAAPAAAVSTLLTPEPASRPGPPAAGPRLPGPRALRSAPETARPGDLAPPVGSGRSRTPMRFAATRRPGPAAAARPGGSARPAGSRARGTSGRSRER